MKSFLIEKKQHRNCNRKIQGKEIACFKFNPAQILFSNRYPSFVLPNISQKAYSGISQRGEKVFPLSRLVLK
jgi:hypothetical protein